METNKQKSRAFSTENSTLGQKRVVFRVLDYKFVGKVGRHNNVGIFLRYKDHITQN